MAVIASTRNSWHTDNTLYSALRLLIYNYLSVLSVLELMKFSKCTVEVAVLSACWTAESIWVQFLE